MKYALIIAEQQADGDVWIEGPYAIEAAENRRRDLWDSGEYTVIMYEFREVNDGTN